MKVFWLEQYHLLVERFVIVDSMLFTDILKGTIFDNAIFNKRNIIRPQGVS